MVYSILFSDEGYYNAMPMLGRHSIPLGGGPDGRGALMRLSTDTGGHFFEVSKEEGIEQIFDAIQNELRGQYSIGYVSDTPVRVSELRKLQVSVKTKGLVVQARDGIGRGDSAAPRFYPLFTVINSPRVHSSFEGRSMNRQKFRAKSPLEPPDLPLRWNVHRAAAHLR